MKTRQVLISSSENRDITDQYLDCLFPEINLNQIVPNVSYEIKDNSVENYILYREKQNIMRFENGEDTALSLIAEPLINKLSKLNPNVTVLMINKHGLVMISEPKFDKIGKTCFLSYKGNSLGRELRKGYYIDLNINTIVKNSPYQNYIFACPMFSNNKFIGYLACMAPNKELMLEYKRPMLISSKIMVRQFNEFLYVKSVTDASTKCTLIMDHNSVIINANNSSINLFNFNPIGLNIADLLVNKEQLHDLIENSQYGQEFLVHTKDKKEPTQCQKLISHSIFTDSGQKHYIIKFKQVFQTHNILGSTYSKEPFNNFIGMTPAILDIKKLSQKLAPTSTTILIQGETGTGKDVLAECIHKQSNRTGAFVPVNCGAITRELINSELFGYEDGAFTGATRGGKIGKLEKADGGTLFLDEIAELPLETQAVLLRFLENNQLVRVGSTNSKTINVRVIAATNKNLKDAIREGNFRQDLYYRLNVFDINIPPLRARKNDINILANHFLNLLSMKHDIPAKSISNEAIKILIQYDWPGNIRQLKNVIEKAIFICEDSEIDPIILERIIVNERNQSQDKNLMSIDDYEQTAIINALKSNHGIISKAAASLNISRTTFYNKVKKFNISIDKNDYKQ
jgi:transcriptional regulator with PAS, ATPase and Fis domain